jgi:hypothetical protein
LAAQKAVQEEEDNMILNQINRNRKLRIALPVLCILMFFVMSVFAQKQEFGFGVGALTYQGELSPMFNYKTAQPAVQLFYRHNFSPAAVLRTNLLFGMLSADPSTSKNPVFKQITPSSFSTPIVEFSMIGEYNFLDFRRTVKPDLFSPYLFGGVGGFYFQPTAENEKEALAFQPVLPFGIGCKFAFGRNWNLNIEAGARKTFTKLLDGRADQLPNATYVSPGGQVVNYPSAQRGYTQEQDWYMFVGFNLSYTIFVIPCPSNQKNGWQPNPGEEQGR